MSDVVVSGMTPVFQWSHRDPSKWGPVLPVFHEFCQHLIPAQVNELLGNKFIRKLLFKDGGVGLADPKSNGAADIPKNRLTDGEGKLIHILVRQGQAEAIFAGLGQKGCKCVGGEVLKFVNEQEKVAAFLLRLVGAVHGRQLELRHQKRTEQIGLVVAQPAFGQIGDEQASVVHQELETDLALHLAENVADHRTEEKLADFVLDGRNRLPLEAGIVAGVFAFPEFPDEGVFDLPDYPGAVNIVREQPINAQQGSVRAFQQRRNRVVEDVFHPRPPGIMPDALESADNPRCHKVPLVRGNIGQEV
jgi:hypothetical protein